MMSTILDPLRRAWEKFIEDEPELARRCTEHYSEFRFRRVEETLWLYLISSQDAPDEILGLEVGEVVVAALGPHHPDVRTDPRTYASISMAEYLVSEQIDFEWASHLEGEAMGAVADLG